MKGRVEKIWRTDKFGPTGKNIQVCGGVIKGELERVEKSEEMRNFYV